MNKCVRDARFSRSVLHVLVLLTVAVVLPSRAQTIRQPPGTPAVSIPHSLRRKLLIERHFESRQPHPITEFNRAVPGSTLLSEHRLSGARVRARVRASLLQASQTSSSTAIEPGVQLRPFLPAGSIPTSVATGDFNGDGHMDFVVANGLSSDLWIYLGKGDGTFQLPRIIPLSKGLSPVAIAAASLRGNGVLDLVVAEFDSSSIGVLLGNGDGTFGYEQLYTLPEPPDSLVVNDFNHDGKMDVAAVMVTAVTPASARVPYIALLFGDGTGKLGSPAITNSGFYSTAWNIASGDVNNDGLPDLLITGPGIENSQVFLNNGDGTFTAGQTILANGAFNSFLDGRLADVNGDGCPDAAIADAATVVWIALGDCSGSFGTPKEVQMGDSNAAVRIVDVNGDGNPDIVTSSLPALDPKDGFLAGNTLSVAFGDGKGNFTTGRNYVGKSQSYSIGVADFNGNGKPDFVTANNDTDTVTVYQNDGSGGFGFPQGLFAGVPGQYPPNNPVSALSFADLNNDGKTDAFSLDEGYNGEYYATGFLNDGTGKFTGPISSDTGISINSNWIDDYRLGHFRDSAHLDMVAIGFDSGSSASGQFILFLAGNGDGTFTKGTPVAATGAQGILTTGDFNKDGKLDFVAVEGQGTHTVTTFEGNGEGTFHALAPVSFTDTTGTVAARIWTGDFNRDGRLDVLIFTTANGFFTTGSSVWEFDGNGDGTFQPGRQLFSDFQPFALADVNGDGSPDMARYDLLWPDGTTQMATQARFETYLGQTDGTFAQSSNDAPYTGSPDLVKPYQQFGDPLATSLVADYNGDGKPDEAAFQWPGIGGGLNYAQFLMGNGDGTFTPTYDIFPFYLQGFPLYAHDLDGDGIADMVEVDSGNSQLHVFKGGRAPALQIALEESVVTGNSGCGWVFPNVASSSAQTVMLSSSVAGVLLPSSVTIPAGALSAKFCYSLDSNFDWRQVFDINAQLNGDTATAYASDSYVLGFSETVSPSSSQLPPLYPGQSSGPLTITLTSSQGYSSTANLYCEGLVPGDSCQFGSSTLDVSSAGPATTAVTLVTGPDSFQYGSNPSFTIVADDGNVMKRQTVTLNLANLEVGTTGSQNALSISPGNGSSQFIVWGIPPYQFSCSGLPPGASCSFSGDQLPYPSTSTITANVDVPAGIADGSYPFSVFVSSQSYTASGKLTLEVLSYSVQAPPSTNDWVIAGTTQDVSIGVQGSSNWNGAGAVAVSCSLDLAATCNGGNAFPGTGSASPFHLSISVPAGTAPGKHQLTVTTVYGGSTQTYTFPLYVVTFGGSLSTSSLTIPAGTSGTLTATLNASAGFSDNVTLSCSGSSMITCSTSPSLAPVVGGTPEAVSVTVATSAAAMQKTGPASFPIRSPLLFAGLLPLMFWNWRLRRRWFAVLFSLVACILILSMGACGGGGSAPTSGGGGGGSSSYSITITANPANTTVSEKIGTLTVTVNH